ncbi:hypothetical protein E2C01_008622 [Portunus trituberculatus]|uniref:Uncharacterized protein n=1 Tax=Portunus trituberculatus TaxID=210409 RepID=A0A5B7D2G5_PORTR|nr:hypothetical protein [Portunus trituberculatus]
MVTSMGSVSQSQTSRGSQRSGGQLIGGVGRAKSRGVYHQPTLTHYTEVPKRVADKQERTNSR